MSPTACNRGKEGPEGVRGGMCCLAGEKGLTRGPRQLFFHLFFTCYLQALATPTTRRVTTRILLPGGKATVH